MVGVGNYCACKTSCQVFILASLKPAECPPFWCYGNGLPQLAWCQISVSQVCFLLLSVGTLRRFGKGQTGWLLLTWIIVSQKRSRLTLLCLYDLWKAACRQEVTFGVFYLDIHDVWHPSRRRDLSQSYHLLMPRRGKGGTNPAVQDQCWLSFILGLSLSSCRFASFM